MEISAKKRFNLRVLFVIGLIVGFISLFCTFMLFLTYSGVPTLDVLIKNNPIGFLFMLLIYVICPIFLICISIIGLLLIK